MREISKCWKTVLGGVFSEQRLLCNCLGGVAKYMFRNDTSTEEMLISIPLMLPFEGGSPSVNAFLRQLPLHLLWNLLGDACTTESATYLYV